MIKLFTVAMLFLMAPRAEAITVTPPTAQFITASTASPASFLLWPVFRATSSMNSALVMCFLQAVWERHEGTTPIGRSFAQRCGFAKTDPRR